MEILILDHRWVQLNVEPPLLLCGDVKIEFSTKLKLDNFGLKSHKTMQSKKEFHFWFNTFFVESSFSSKLCHDVVKQNSEPIHTTLNGGGRHGRVDEEVETTEDDEDDDDRKTSGEREKSLSNLLKASSISDDQLLQGDRTKRISSSSNLLSAASATSANNNSSTTTQLSFPGPCAVASSSEQQRRMRHSSVPQPQQPPSSYKMSGNVISANNSAAGSSSSCCDDGNERSSSGIRSGVPESTTPVSLRLRKPQIDKVFKDKQCKVYPEDFQINLFLLKPIDQSDAGAFAGSPVCKLTKPTSSCDVGASCTGTRGKSSPESSSEDDEDEEENLRSGEVDSRLSSPHPMLNHQISSRSACDVIASTPLQQPPHRQPPPPPPQQQQRHHQFSPKDLGLKVQLRNRSNKHKKEHNLVQSDWI